MVARGVGAAGPVLLACRQWDPRGLARRLPSFGAGAWRCAPLLPWRVQCPGRVCAALAAGSGGLGRLLVSCLPRFPLPAQRVLRCVWRAVPSGCPLPSLAGTPFHAVCALRGLGPVALLVFPACPLCVCALALSRRPLPSPHLPRLVWRAHLAWSQCWALVGPFHAVRAPPRVLPRSRAPFGVLGGGGGPVPFPPFLAWGCALPAGWVCAPGASLRRGVGWGGGGAACAPCPPTVRPGGPVGWGVALPRSVPLPSLGRQQGGCHWRRSGHGGRGPHTAPVRARVPSPGAVRVASWRVGTGSPALRGSCGSRRLGRGGWALFRPPTRASLFCRGGGGVIPSASGGWGLAPLWLARRWGGGGGTGGVAPWLPCSPSGGRPVAPFSAPFSACAFGRGRGAAPCAGCGLPGRGGGGGGAARETPPPEAPTDPIRPSALPERIILRASLVMLWSWGARPPYCSGSLSRVASGRGPCVAPARWCGAARRPRPPREQAVGGAGARGVRVQLHPPTGDAVPSGGGGTFPRPLGGGGPASPRLAGRGGTGGTGGEGGGGGARRRSWPPCPVGWPVALAPVTLCLQRAPLGYTRAVGVAGRPWASGTARSAASGSVWRGGGEISSPWPAPPPSPGRPLSGPLRVRLPGCRRSVVGRQRVMRVRAGGPPGALGARLRLSRLRCPPPGVATPPGGCGGRCPPGRLPSALGLGGGEGGVPWLPDAAPRRPRGGGLVVPALGGQPSTGGAHSSPVPLHPLRAGPSLDWGGGGEGR